MANPDTSWSDIYTDGVKVCLINVTSRQLLSRNVIGDIATTEIQHHRHPDQQWLVKAKANGTVALVHVGSGMALDHYWGKSIKAFYPEEDHVKHRWTLIPSAVQPGAHSIVNFDTRKVLEHDSRGAITAESNNLNNPCGSWFVYIVRLFSLPVAQAYPHDPRLLPRFFSTARLALLQALQDSGTNAEHLMAHAFADPAINFFRIPDTDQIIAVILHPPHAPGIDSIGGDDTIAIQQLLFHLHVRAVRAIPQDTFETERTYRIIDGDRHFMVQVEGPGVPFRGTSPHYFIRNNNAELGDLALFDSYDPTRRTFDGYDSDRDPTIIDPQTFLNMSRNDAYTQVAIAGSLWPSLFPGQFGEHDEHEDAYTQVAIADSFGLFPGQFGEHDEHDEHLY